MFLINDRRDPGSRINIEGEHIVVYHAERVNLNPKGFGVGLTELPTFNQPYLKVMRFTLVNEKGRTFRVQRWCFRGSIDRWIDLFESGSERKLSDLVKKFCPNIGHDSFFELM